MPVPSTIADLSTVIANNSPAGSDSVTTGAGPDEYFRALSAIIKREQAQATAVASAATVDLGAIATGNYVHITGTTTITSFGTIDAGVERTVVFDGALTLTHNATSLILPGGANITTAAGDASIFRSEGAGNWRCVSYVKASGSPVGSYQPLDLELTAIAGLTSAANTVPFFTGSGTAALKTLGTASGDIPLVGTSSATDVIPGLVELATSAEAVTGTDTARAVTPAAVTAAIAAHAIGEGQTWQDVSASRAVNTTYTNTTGRPIEVTATLRWVSGSTYQARLLVDGITRGLFLHNGSTVNYSAILGPVIVPPGSSYQVGNEGGLSALASWNELR